MPNKFLIKTQTLRYHGKTALKIKKEKEYVYACIYRWLISKIYIYMHICIHGVDGWVVK